MSFVCHYLVSLTTQCRTCSSEFSRLGIHRPVVVTSPKGRAGIWGDRIGTRQGTPNEPLPTEYPMVSRRCGTHKRSCEPNWVTLCRKECQDVIVYLPPFRLKLNIAIVDEHFRHLGILLKMTYYDDDYGDCYKIRCCHRSRRSCHGSLPLNDWTSSESGGRKRPLRSTATVTRALEI
jgi:hypothetical protein